MKMKTFKKQQREFVVENVNKYKFIECTWNNNNIKMINS